MLAALGRSDRYLAKRATVLTEQHRSQVQVLPMAVGPCATASHTATQWRAARRARDCAKAQAAPSPFPFDVDALLRRCGEPEVLPMGGRLLRGALTESEQRWMYEEIGRHSDPASDDMESLRATLTPQAHAEGNSKNSPMPYVCWLHPYARRSSARARPTHFLEWADRLMHALAPASSSLTINSMVAQLYAAGGGLRPHLDENLSWGISISLGSEATFECLPAGAKATRVTLRSGDIVVAEFGKLHHAVSTSAQPPPAWWARVETFGPRTRCNVLFRQALSKARQRDLCERRAMKVHGMSIAQLVAMTGKEEAWFLKLLVAA